MKNTVYQPEESVTSEVFTTELHELVKSTSLFMS